MNTTSVAEIKRINTALTSAENLAAWLDERIDEIKLKLEATEVWNVLTSDSTDPTMLQHILRELYLEIVWYQHDALSGAISAIGELPRSVSAKLIQSMLVHQADEFDHGLMARQDYIALGGEESRVDKSNMSPSACAIAAFWNYCAHRMNPFSYLGALYLFEALTPWISETLLARVKKAGFPANSYGFGEFHAIEDIKHRNLVRHMIGDVAKKHPESIRPIMHGNQCFEYVFPVPIFDAAYKRAVNGRKS